MISSRALSYSLGFAADQAMARAAVHRVENERTLRDFLSLRALRLAGAVSRASSSEALCIFLEYSGNEYEMKAPQMVEKRLLTLFMIGELSRYIFAPIEATRSKPEGDMQDFGERLLLRAAGAAAANKPLSARQNFGHGF